jgi:hypothetical protein
VGQHQSVTVADATPYFRRDRRAGFWQITTSGYIDSPQEARLIDLMRNGDGTLSIFSTLLDHSAPVSRHPPEHARAE